MGATREEGFGWWPIDGILGMRKAITSMGIGIGHRGCELRIGLFGGVDL